MDPVLIVIVLMLGPLFFVLLLSYWMLLAKSKSSMVMIAISYVLACVFIPILYGWTQSGWPDEDLSEALSVVALVIATRLFDLFACQVALAFRGLWRDLGAEASRKKFEAWGKDLVLDGQASTRRSVSHE